MGWRVGVRVNILWDVSMTVSKRKKCYFGDFCCFWAGGGRFAGRKRLVWQREGSGLQEANEGMAGTPAGVRESGALGPVVSLRSTTGYRLASLRDEMAVEQWGCRQGWGCGRGARKRSRMARGLREVARAEVRVRPGL